MNLFSRVSGLAPVLRVALTAALFWLFLRFFLPWCAPLLGAWALAAALEGPVRGLCRVGLSRPAAAGVVFTLFTLALCTGVGLGLWWLAGEGLALLERLPLLLSGAGSWPGRLKDLADEALVAAPVPLQEPLRQALEGILDAVGDLLSSAAAQAAVIAGRWASSLPGLAFGAGTALLAGALLSADRPAVSAFFRRQLSRRGVEKLDAAGAALRSALGGWLKAQGILVLLNAGLLAVGLLLLGVKGALLWAFFTALVDLLPVLGSGAVLLPWAVVALLRGDGGLALGLAALWGGVSLVRGLLEPRLVGKEAGLPPLAAVAAFYLGFTAAGPAGMILAPLAALALKVLHDRDVIRLWR